MADNSQRYLVICNPVNLNVFPTYSKSPGLCSLDIAPIQFVYAGVLRLFHFECIQLCISRILFQVSKTQLFLLRLFDYKFKFRCECCEVECF